MLAVVKLSEHPENWLLLNDILASTCPYYPSLSLCNSSSDLSENRRCILAHTVSSK